MEAFYRLIFKRVLKISWQHKWLWLMAFFAAFIGNGSIYDALLRGFNNISEGQSAFSIFFEYANSGVVSLFSLEKFRALWQSDASAFALAVFGTLMLICVFLLFVALAVICQAAVVDATVAIDKKKTMGIKEGFSAGVRHFWPVLEINVFTKVVLFGLLLLLSYFVSLIVFKAQWLNLLAYIISFIVFLLLGIVIYFLTIYGTAYVILRGRSAVEAIKSAWKLFTRHFLLNLEMGLLLFLLSIVVAICLVLVNFFVLTPFFVLYVVSLVAASKILAGLFLGIISVFVVASAMLAAAWWSSFQLGVWSILFEELELRGGKSKVVRIFEYLKVRAKRT